MDTKIITIEARKQYRALYGVQEDLFCMKFLIYDRMMKFFIRIIGEGEWELQTYFFQE